MTEWMSSVKVRVTNSITTKSSVDSCSDVTVCSPVQSDASSSSLRTSHFISVHPATSSCPAAADTTVCSCSSHGYHVCCPLSDSVSIYCHRVQCSVLTVDNCSTYCCQSVWCSLPVILCAANYHVYVADVVYLIMLSVVYFMWTISHRYHLQLTVCK